MKPKKRLSAKAVQISKDQSQLLITVIVATLLSVFCLFSVKNLVAKSIYQGRVISARHKSADQIKTDIRNANTLVAQYKDVFIGDNGQNIIGGKNDANVYAIPPNGDNGRIVIDALPTSYNFPALLTSLQQMMNSNNLGSQSIGGTDQTATADNSPSGSPKPVNMDMIVSGTGTYTNAAHFIHDLERSIRPFDITSLSLSGNESSLIVNLNVTTYYQPSKTVSITSKEIH
jgi:hypothetical protein